MLGPSLKTGAAPPAWRRINATVPTEVALSARRLLWIFDLLALNSRWRSPRMRRLSIIRRISYPPLHVNPEGGVSNDDTASPPRFLCKILTANLKPSLVCVNLDLHITCIQKSNGLPIPMSRGCLEGESCTTQPAVPLAGLRPRGLLYQSFMMRPFISALGSTRQRVVGPD